MSWVEIEYRGLTFRVDMTALSEVVSILDDQWSVGDGKWLAGCIDRSFCFEETPQGYDFWEAEYKRAHAGVRIGAHAEVLLREFHALAEFAAAGMPETAAEPPCDPNDLSVFDLTVGGV